MIFQALAKQYADTGCLNTAIWTALHRGVESVVKIARLLSQRNDSCCDLIHSLNGTGNLVPRRNISSRMFCPFGSHRVQADEVVVVIKLRHSARKGLLEAPASRIMSAAELRLTLHLGHRKYSPAALGTWLGEYPSLHMGISSIGS